MQGSGMMIGGAVVLLLIGGLYFFMSGGSSTATPAPSQAPSASSGIEKDSAVHRLEVERNDAKRLREVCCARLFVFACAARRRARLRVE